MTEDVALLEVAGLRIWSGSDALASTITVGTDLLVGAGDTVGSSVNQVPANHLPLGRSLLPEGVFAEGSVRYPGRELMDLPEKEVRKR